MDNKADLNSRNREGLTALHFVTKESRYFLSEKFNFLLKNDLDINIKDNDNKNALYYFQFCKHFSFKDYFCLYEEIANSDMNTALHFELYKLDFSFEKIKNLIEGKCDVNAKNK